MARLDDNNPTLLIERDGANTEEGMRDPSSRQPTVLSCGGIFIPRPKIARPNDHLYHVLNMANEKEPTKLVDGEFTRNLLQDILHKESMN